MGIPACILIYFAPGFFLSITAMLKRSLLSAGVLLIMLSTELWPVESLAQVQGGNGLPTAPPAPAFGNRVVLYSGVKYTGRAKSFNLGTFGPAALGFPLLNNVSSIQLPQGWYLNATARDGRRYTFTQSNAMLSNIGWDNVLVSGYIGRGNPGNSGGNPGNSGGNQGGNGGSQGGNGGGGNTRPVAVLYYALDFGGKSINFGAGSFGLLGGDAATNITGIYVSPGFAVQVYDQPRLQGRSQLFTTSVSNLTRYNWNDRVASIKVFRVRQGGRPPFGRP